VLASVRSATLVGVDGQVVTVEVHVSRGLPGYQVVGLPDTAVRESRERVRAALLSSELSWPLQRITVNLAPGDVPKSGSGFEVAVALGLLLAEAKLPAGSLDGVGVVGELGLDGTIRAVPGVLALVDALARSGVDSVVVPLDCAAEAALVPGVAVRPARSILQLRACLKGEEAWPTVPEPLAGDRPDHAPDGDALDLADVRGLREARSALSAAAAGNHHLFMVGPPGVGKTMLAQRIRGILPPLDRSAALEVTRIRSAAGLHTQGVLSTAAPFRAPHHTASTAAIVGGGARRARPGEVTLAHRGVLFCDELGEFAPVTLDALRQPLEEGTIRIARQSGTVTFPARFLLVACSNPCPCGRDARHCHCSGSARLRYERRLSAPLLDRFDLRLRVEPPDGAVHGADNAGDSTAVTAQRVAAAVALQERRYGDVPWARNGDVPAGALDETVPLSGEVLTTWRSLCERRRLNGRGAAAIRRVARTLADLDGERTVGPAHMLRAADMREPWA